MPFMSIYSHIDLDYMIQIYGSHSVVITGYNLVNDCTVDIQVYYIK